MAPPLNISPLFFTNDWSAGNASVANTTCASPIGWCYPMSQNPTLLPLANGNLGMGFSAITNFSSAPTCPVGGGGSTRIAWSTSTDGGKSFAPLQYIGNNGSSGCPYPEGLEPSFAVSSTGEIFAAFIATNASSTAIFTSSAPGAYGNGRPVLDYLYRPDSALALITSSDNGTTWSATKLLVKGGNMSMPRLATFGRSVYIAYTNITNSTRAIPGSPTDSTGVQFVHSLDAGATWSAPLTIPAHMNGATSNQNNNSMDPSISVSAAGEIAVAYAANRSCYAFCTGFQTVYANDLVVSTSINNGSSWRAPIVIARGVSEFGYYTQNAGGPGLWEGAIDTSLEWGTGSNLYVAWSQSEDMNLTDQYAGQLDFANAGIYSAASTNSGSTWTTRSVTGPLPALDYNQQVFGFGYFNPALGVHNGTVYLAYSYYNWTNGGSGRNAYVENAYGLGNGEWMTSSTDGVTWASPTIVIMDRAGSGITDFDYWGYLGSIAFDGSGNPVIAYALQTAFITFTTTLTVPVALMVATVFSGPTTTVTIEETGLAPGTTWEAQISGQTITTTAPEFNITDAPVGQSFYVVWPGPIVSVGYRAAIMPQISVAPIFVANGPSVDVFNFSVFYGIQFSVNPTNTPGFTIEVADFNQNNGYQFYWSWSTYIYAFGSFSNSGGTAFPWYFPAGSWLNLSTGYFGSAYYYGAGFVGYWSGTGPGSYTGNSAQPAIQLNGPINETAWMAAFGVYSERVGAPSLPSSSSFSFAINGGTYNGTGGSSVVVTNLSTGGYAISNISATSTKSGWQYFGYSDMGNPVVIPNVPEVNLSFAQVNLSSAPGLVSFHAAGLPNGVDWSLAFNGTEFASTTPWINVTTRSGNFPVESFPTLAASGNQSYVPTGVSSDGSVVVGQSYDVNFSSAYKVQLETSPGGTLSVTPGTYFLAPGNTLSVTATPSNGFRFGGWTGSGTGSVSSSSPTANVTANAPIVETATFLPLVANRFNVTINESGVPNGTAWSVVVGGVGYTSITPVLVIPNEYSCTYSGSLGRYSIAVPFTHANASGLRYIPTSAPQTVCGGSATATISFGPEYSLSVTAGAGGSVVVTPTSGGSTSSPYWIPLGGSANLLASPLVGYQFVAWVGAGPGSYSGTGAQTSVAPTGGAITEVAEFAPVAPTIPPTYTATFVASLTMVAGTTWTISNASGTWSSTSTTLVLTGLSSGTYTYSVGTSVSPDGQTRYLPIAAKVTATVHANVNVPVPFATQFRLTISSVGPGTVTPASSWIAAGASLPIRSLPTGSAVFLGWAGTGTGSYSGPNPNVTIAPTSPVTEVASFVNAPPASVVTTTNSAPSLWANPLLWAGLAVVGLVVGIAVGAMLARNRRPPAVAWDGASASSGTEPEPGDEPPVGEMPPGEAGE